MAPHENSLSTSPSLLWRLSSSLVMGITGLLSRGFIHGFNRTEVYGLEGFLKILDERKGPEFRERGLLTISNHLSVLDDPLIWGTLPLRYQWDPSNLRWGLGSHDICFQSNGLTKFFSLGQVLPTHRLLHSHPLGGPSQPIMTEAIRLLSKGPFPAYNFPPPTLKDNESGLVSEKMGSMSTVGDPRRYDYPPLPNHPTTYAQNSCAWLHAFPEGRVHQPSTIGPSPDSPSSQNDYSLLPLKWGVSRLLLETSPRPPLLVPMFIEGFDGIMCEDRPFPRFLPRIGKRLIVIFGEAVDVERDERWKELRERWRKLEKKVKNGVEKEKSVDGGWFWTKAEESRDNSPEIKPMPNGSLSEDNQLGVLSGDLMFGEEAVQIRKECTVLIREEILKLRRRRGWPDEDARQGLRPVIDDPVELEGKGRGKRYLDGSLVGRA